MILLLQCRHKHFCSYNTLKLLNNSRSRNSSRVVHTSISPPSYLRREASNKGREHPPFRYLLSSSDSFIHSILKWIVEYIMAVMLYQQCLMRWIQQAGIE
jgi:hypothetical protein